MCIRDRGKSLVPLIHGEVDRLRDCAIAGYYNFSWSIITDDWSGYTGLAKAGYKHRVDASGLVNIHRVFSNLKAWLLGTHHGAVSKQHIQAYLNEYTFRFNRRRTPMAAFQTMLGIGSQRLGPTYKGLTGVVKGSGKWIHPNPSKRGKTMRKATLLDEVLDWRVGEK